MMARRLNCLDPARFARYLPILLFPLSLLRERSFAICYGTYLMIPVVNCEWCLSKVRSLIGEQRVMVQGDGIALDLSDCFVDAIETQSAVKHNLKALSLTDLRNSLRCLSATFSTD